MLVTILCGSGYYSRLSQALSCFSAGEVNLFSGASLRQPQVREKALKAISQSKLVLIEAFEEPFWEEFYLEEMKEGAIKLAWLSVMGLSPEKAARSNIAPRELNQIAAYLDRGGDDNAYNLIKYLLGLVSGSVSDVPPPINLPRFGLWHPKAPELFYLNKEDYLKFYGSYKGLENLSFVGLILHRHYWCVDTPIIETTIIERLEEDGLGVLPIFISGEDSGASEEASQFLKEVFSPSPLGPKVKAVVKLTSMFQKNLQGESPSFPGDDGPALGSVRIFRELNAPIFQPLVSFRQSNSQWEQNTAGLASELSWSVAMPEFEGAIEPHYAGGTLKAIGETHSDGLRQPHLERIGHLVQRVVAWVRLSEKPISERKVAFILHNAPCASVEATAGTASGLDPFESLKNILSQMKLQGYQVKVPQSGGEIIEDMITHKAFSEFRWTTVQEIVAKGGALALIPTEKYRAWFDLYPDEVKQRLIQTWGQPPGEELEGVKPSMVLDGNLVISGRTWGDKAVILIQPKRGCAGSRCDGRVCLILQDPLIPPPHQYLAAYRYLQEPDEFGADLIVHVGAHGNLEYLPGKSVALSQSCYPDLTLGKVPHLYIYNSDVTADGITAKRRSYAVLVDHLQALYQECELYGELSELRELMGQYNKLSPNSNISLKEEIERLIRQKASQSSLASELDLESNDFNSLSLKIRQALALTSDSLIEGALHVFGQRPIKSEAARFIYSILRFESPSQSSLRSALTRAKGLSWEEINLKKLDIIESFNLTGAEIVEEINRLALNLITKRLEGLTPNEIFNNLSLNNIEQDTRDELFKLFDRIDSIFERLNHCQEIGSLLNAFNGGYVSPGPSALITRGREDVLPTGRNFYSKDPSLSPTPAAWEVGQKMAEAVCQRFLTEEGRYPQSVAFFWISSDLINADGEDLAQMLALLGVKPLWAKGGKVMGFEIIPKEKLARPRIDLAVRTSGVVRDSFPEALALLDGAIKAVAELDEEDNYPRLHTLDNLAKDPQDKPLNSEESHKRFLRAASRVFSTAPGSYSSGVYYAVMASAWENEADLADIFIEHNAYIYGDENFGLAAPKEFKRTLERVDVNEIKIYGDEQDFLNCGGFFGAVGGLSLTAQRLKGSEVKNYCLDTRSPAFASVRSLSEELGRSFRVRLLNPAWIESMKKHGYKGAAEISRRVTNAYGWQATAKEIDHSFFDRLAQTYFLNSDNRAFFEIHNPFALEEIGRRLLEAESRGLWKTDHELLESLKESYLSLEGALEESVEAYGGELQGGAVDVVTARALPKWREKMEAFLGQSLS
ncbi:MAG: cobaltochelatase subunit CobN [Deltaproteobacteria bacterium]|jgi:cobaltochelatase CobN|nr:cobaltochelatase subunit CobN [Deltaproteobacteria bacterium]